MTLHLPRGRGRPVAIVTTAAACMVAAGVWYASSPASAGALSGTMYVDPNSQAARWVAANGSDSRMPVIRDKIASQPQARWFASFNINTVQNDIATYVNAANSAGRVPVLSVYGITNRDCGGASSGGAPDLNQYQTWITNLSRGLGSQMQIIILETDSIALQTCLSGDTLNARNQALSTATRTIKAANPNAKVYLDGGHSAWNSASVQAQRLQAAGVQYADGFYTNVSNFQPTANEANFGRSVISALSGMGISGKRQIIDTSRNGGAAGDWCADDNTDRRIGQYPTLNTGDANIDGYLWVKPPGEADGCSFTAGSFQPALAYSLANGAPNPPPASTTTAPSSPATSSAQPSASSSSPSTGPTDPPSSTAPPVTGACSASYALVGTWQGGFQGQITVTAGSAPITTWTVTWPVASDTSVTQAWNGTVTISGGTATAKPTSWNAALAAGTTAQVGFIGSGSSASSIAVTCTAG